MSRPLLPWSDGSQRAWLSGDLVSGVLVVAIAIPLSMEMAEVAWVPPVTGLYTCVLPLIAFACLGASRRGLPRSSPASIMSTAGRSRSSWPPSPSSSSCGLFDRRSGALLVDAAAVTDIDATAADTLRDLSVQFHRQQRSLRLTGVTPPVEALLDRYGLDLVDRRTPSHPVPTRSRPGP